MTFQSIYVTDGSTAYAFYSYADGGMKFVDGFQFIGLVIDGYVDGQDDSEDGAVLRSPDVNFVFKGNNRSSPSEIQHSLLLTSKNDNYETESSNIFFFFDVKNSRKLIQIRFNVSTYLYYNVGLHWTLCCSTEQ